MQSFFGPTQNLENGTSKSFQSLERECYISFYHVSYVLSVGSDAHQAKAIELLNPFCFAIEKRHPSKYSSTVAKKEERGKRKEGTLLWYIFLHLFYD